jgi:1,4-dihydroxy-2-naphthoyl-CoA hydrolase
MSIWYNKNLTLQNIENLGQGNIGEHLGIKITALHADSLEATMPVDQRTKQPYGLLHGGASVVLAETLGSVASALVINDALFMAVGLEINANHIKGVTQGFVTGICTPIHIGASTHVWNIKIINEAQKLVCISRLTTAIIKKR